MRRRASALYWDPELDARPWADVQRWQGAQIGPVLRRVQSESEFYRERFQGFDFERLFSFESLTRLPFTTKDELRVGQQHRSAGRPLGDQQARPLKSLVQMVSSSGTSGQPVLYGLTQRDVVRWADCIANMFYTAGVRPGDVVVHLTSLPMVAGGLPFADGLRRVGAALAWMGGYPPERVLAQLPAMQASVLSATTSHCVYLTEHCESLIGALPSSRGIRRIIGGGEPGLAQPDLREKLRLAWAASDLREIMGLSDVVAGMWAECSDESGMHFTASRHVAIELIDPTTGEQLAWQDGTTGEVVYTALDREATPLVRFRSGDQVVVTSVNCACGRTAPKIRCIGRTDDMLIYKGMNVFPTAIRDVILTTGGSALAPHVRVWRTYPGQVRFDEPIRVEVEAIAPDSEGRTALRTSIEDAVRKSLQVRIDVSIVDPGTLPRSSYKASLLYTPEESRDGDTAIPQPR